MRLGEFALKLEQIGRRLHFREAAQRARCFLEALAAIFGCFLAEGFDALGGKLRRSDQRLDIAAGEVGQFLEQAGILFEDHAGLLVHVAEDGLNTFCNSFGCFRLHC